ncbi:pantoate--beta-alanine ligase [Elusimicrobiota bacterium]
MEIIERVKDAQSWADSIRSGNKTIGFVPTMGALHVAHSSLIERARRENDQVIVSIFINPTQFGPDEDLDSYPRTFEEDKKLCSEGGADAIFYPAVEEMYGKGRNTTVCVDKITLNMCGKCRPGHFNGVAIVVAKLFNIVKPHRAYFGQKDYQQFRVIQDMVNDLDFDVEPVMCPIFREEDGLAVSSRNKYLNEEERRQAAGISRALKKGEELIKNGEQAADVICSEMDQVVRESIPSCKIDYLGVFDTGILEPVDVIDKEVVLAAAVWVGKARLIDNLLIKTDG